MVKFEELNRVQVTFQAQGFHRWVRAPERYDYLGTLHHHTFVVTVGLEVMHNDREIEINDLAHKLHRWFAARVDLFAGDLEMAAEEVFTFMSCEQMAKALANRVLDEYGAHREIKVAVLEDGIHGGIYERRRPQ